MEIKEEEEEDWGSAVCFRVNVHHVVDVQVGQLNNRDQTVVLRDQLYSEVQKDWPGYTPLDQTLLKRHLVR